MAEEIPNHDALLDDSKDRQQELVRDDDEEERADDPCQPEDWED